MNGPRRESFVADYDGSICQPRALECINCFVILRTQIEHRDMMVAMASYLQLASLIVVMRTLNVVVITTFESTKVILGYGHIAHYG